MPYTDSTLSRSAELEEKRGRFIATRILAHPDPARVGDFAPLFDGPIESTIRSVSINRLQPDFRAPLGASTGPLDSRWITRNLLRLDRVADSLWISTSAPEPLVEVNHAVLERPRMLTAAEIEAGIVILFGSDLALWVGWLELIDPAPPIEGLIGDSSVMQRLRQQVHRVADLEVPVLLRGETGVGKELVAAAIHKHSRRARAAYVVVNVAGVPGSMAASELFGHKRGAFTGAIEERKGYFAQASGGTLFLDEIGDVPFDVQALLLRAVQEGVIQPLGGTTTPVDVRLIAATDSDLESAVARREFREPLLRRFSYEIHVPPLRARRDDIGPLFYFLLRARLEEMGEAGRLDSGSRQPFVPAGFVARLASSKWSGNVRELANVALRFAVENRGRARGSVSAQLRELLGPLRDTSAEQAPGGALPEPTQPRAPALPSLPAAPLRPARESRAEPGQTAATVSNDEILQALEAEGFRRERAARRLGVSKSYLYKRLAASSESRSARSLGSEEIAAALDACGGEVAAAAAHLRISLQALRLQMRRLRVG